MTDYHLVIKEELEQIWRNCKHPEWDNREGDPCEGCEYESLRGVRCTQKIRELKDKVITRPDPLEILENRYVDAYLNPDNYNEINAKEVYTFIKSLRTNPDDVIKREREKVMDMILKDLGERSMIGKAIELVEKERGEGWLREQMIKLLEVK